MKYRYRNRKTGEMISTTNRIGGKNWEPVEEVQNPFVEEKSTDEKFFEEDPIEEYASEEDPAEEESVEEAPVEKPKGSRRSKK